MSVPDIWPAAVATGTPDKTPAIQPPSLADLATRADGGDSFVYFEGSVNAFAFGEEALPLFRLAGFNVRRRVEHSGNLYMTSREIAFYLDPASGDVLENWTNPKTGRINKVVPVLNDPVNVKLSAAPATDFGPCWSYRMEVYPCYPLPGQEKRYTSGEHFSLFLDKQSWLQGRLDRVVYSWSRTGPWLQWMEMGETQGFLQYHANGRCLENAGDLPNWLAELVVDKYPQYLSSPCQFNPAQKNSTSFGR
jgi:hypothetical protein